MFHPVYPTPGRRVGPFDNLDNMPTPNTPYGISYEPNPSKLTRKMYKRTLELMPESDYDILQRNKERRKKKKAEQDQKMVDLVLKAFPDLKNDQKINDKSEQRANLNGQAALDGSFINEIKDPVLHRDDEKKNTPGAKEDKVPDDLAREFEELVQLAADGGETQSQGACEEDTVGEARNMSCFLRKKISETSSKKISCKNDPEDDLNQHNLYQGNF